MAIELILFGTSSCHLCEQAQVLLGAVLVDFPEISLEVIDIAEHTQWQDRYAIRIPVLYHPHSGKELGWFFDEISLKDFLYAIDGEVAATQ